MSPDRILLYGVTGSGKSTAALALGERTGLPVTLVDELTWLPGWVPVEQSRQREVIGEVVAGERWVLDSSYAAWLDLVLPRVDLVVGDGQGNQTFAVPNLINMPEDEAVTLLMGQGLQKGEVFQVPAEDGQVPGTVVRQRPVSSPDATIRMGQLVDIWIAK